MTKIESLGHACFRITDDNGYQLVIDPYGKDTVPGLKLIDNLQANLVITTHGHGDHNAVDEVTVVDNGISNPFTIDYLTVPHDDQNGELRGMNKIYIITDSSNHKIIHFGDTGRDLTDEEREALMNSDVAIIPCGGHFTIDASQAKKIIEDIKPKVAVLIHYRSDIFGYDVLEHIDSIANKFDNVQRLSSSSFNIGDIEGIITLVPEGN